MELDRSIIFRNNDNKSAQGLEPPLFKFVIPQNEYFYSDRDIFQEDDLINAEPSDYWK